MNSIGANVHLALSDSGPYSTANLSTLASLLKSSGILHLRDGMQGPISAYQQLASNGLRFDFIMTPQQSSAYVNAFLSNVGSGVADACEGDNEYDTQHNPSDTNWPQTDRQDQMSVYSACHSAGLSVYAPSLSASSDAATLGSVSGSADYGNMHDYFTWRNPGTPGYGGGDSKGHAYGGLAYNQDFAAVVAPNVTAVATETGYGSDPGSGSITTYLPEAIRARYLVRTFLEGFRSGVPRTYAYEFADEGSAPYSQMGLVTNSLQAKASYTAVSGLISLLSDGGGAFTPMPLPYTLSGNDSALHSIVLEKSDKSYWIVLWKEAEEYNGDQKTYEPQSPENITLAFGSTPATLTNFVLQDAGTYSQTSITAASSISLSIDGHPALVKVTLAPQVSMVQAGVAYSAGSQNYAVSLPSSPTVGNLLLGHLVTSIKPQAIALTGFGTIDALRSNTYLANQTQDRVVASKDSSSFQVTDSVSDLSSTTVIELAGADGANPLGSDTSNDGTNAMVVCPASSGAATLRANSLVFCIVSTVNGNNGNNVLQTPTAPSGWSFDYNSNGAYQEIFVFHRTALTTAGEKIPSNSIEFDTLGGTPYLTGWHAQTIVVQPPS